MSGLRVLVTGASRGIGHALVRAYAARGDDALAGVRDPSRVEPFGPGVTIVPLDVTDATSVRAARAQLGPAPLDVLVNNAGINGRAQRAPGMDFAQLERVVAVNSIGPARMYDAFADLLRAAVPRGRLVNVSSEAGSLGQFRASSKPDYAMSKAALNALTRWIAVQEENVVAVAIDPGWTRTAMGGADAPSTPEQTAARLIDAIDRLTDAHSGRFLSTELRDIPF